MADARSCVGFHVLIKALESIERLNHWLTKLRGRQVAANEYKQSATQGDGEFLYLSATSRTSST